MAQRIERDGKFYRMRRGKLVEIPQKWVGRVTTSETIRQRPSKLTGKVKRVVKDSPYEGKLGRYARFKDARQAPLDPEL